MARTPKHDEKLLKRIYSNYEWCLREWSPIFEAGNRSVRFIAGDPWDPRDVNARETAQQKRPHITFDEGSQYINMFCGQARQQKRAVKVEPVDERVDSKTAEIMQGRVQHIEYIGRAQTHYIKGLNDAATRGYGWISIRKKYSSPDGREQEPCINPVPNPDSRMMDPNAKQSDGSDAEFMFVRDICKKDYVKRRWPKAKNIGGDEVNTVTLTEYWEVTKKVVDCKYLIDDGSGDEGVEILKSQLPEGAKVSDDSITFGEHEFTILDEREIEEKSICKYICQLVEPGMAKNELPMLETIQILEEEDWDGEYIPEIPVFGQEYYITSGGVTKKVYLSMISRAEQAMQLLNYVRTAEAELVSMIPKTRAMGYEGQFEGHEAEWANIGSSPLAYLQVKPVVDPITGQTLPLPQLLQWNPPIQALEVLAQSCMNAIRSAIGQLASPELDKTKSGIALQRIREGGESAVYHILDNFDRALTQVGRVMGDLMERTHDTKRKIAIRDNAGEQKLVQINSPYDNEKGERVHYPVERGAFSYTMTTGPSYQSQFEQASDFIDVLVTKVPQLLLDGQGHTIFGDLFVKLKNMGPIGDQIAERFKKMLRPELQEGQVDIPPAVQAELQKAQLFINHLTEKVTALQDELEKRIFEQQAETDRADKKNITSIVVAEINASVKEEIAKLQMQMDQIAMTANAQYEAISGSLQHQRELEKQSVTHRQALEQQDAAHAQGLEAQEAAAALQPAPEGQ